MRKRTLLSHIKAVKRLVLLTLILAAAFPATIREAKAAAGTTFKVKVTDGYLALRSEKAFDKGNEIGQLNTGDLVEVTNRKDATYWYEYVPRLDKSGYLDFTIEAKGRYFKNNSISSGVTTIFKIVIR